MTTKRFKLRLSTLGNGMITDTQKRKDLYFEKEFLEVTLLKANEWLNALNDENEQLKQRNKRLEEKIQRERRVSAKQHLKWGKEAETKIKELSEENEQLKKELLFFYDVANCECSTNWKGDMEKGCKRFFNCTYEEAKEKYGDYDGMWWEINDC